VVAFGEAPLDPVGAVKPLFCFQHQLCGYFFLVLSALVVSR